MKLITELVNEQIEFLSEEKDGKKLLYVQGPYISVDTPNRNNRVYPKGMMEPIVENYINSKIKEKTAYGEWGHPQGPKINEDRISHRITDLKWDGKNVIGKAVVLDEGMGKIMRSIMETGGRFGMSTRGLGSVKPNDKGLQEVQSDFKLVTVDAVTDPSGVGCWVNGILEDVDWVYDATRNTFMENKVEEIVEEIKKDPNPKEITARKIQLFEMYLKGLAAKVNEEDRNQMLIYRKKHSLGVHKTIVNHDGSGQRYDIGHLVARKQMKKAKGLGFKSSPTTSKGARRFNESRSSSKTK